MFIQPLFPTPLGFYELEASLADDIEAKVVSRLNLLDYKQNETYTDYYKDNKLFELEKELPVLHSFIFDCRNHYLNETAFTGSSDIQYWFQDYRTKEAVHHLHHHGIHGISGVYWVRANENAGEFRMENPNPLCNYAEVSDRNNYFTQDYASVHPKKGLLILFPAYLKHEVLAGNKNIERTTLAFNFGKN